MIGIIGGSGLENPDILIDSHEEIITTPYGDTSSPINIGLIDGVKVAILSRHGRQHTITPTRVNNKANIWALKSIGCKAIIGTTACGSLTEEIGRGDIVIPSQLIDFTKHRKSTYFDSFEPGKLKHTSLANPFDKNLARLLEDSITATHLKFHSEATLITIEGPRFSTKAESFMFKSWGAHIINMSTAPEAALAAELEIPYATIALVTDYDCWKDDEEPVSVEEIMSVFNKNVIKIIDVLKKTIKRL